MASTDSTNTQLSERVATLEIKLDNLSDKVAELKVDVKEMHECLDKTREDVMAELKAMHNANTEQHNDLTGKVSELEKFKTKGIYLVMGAVAALGWAAGHTNALGLFK